jgi:hypothetical protein
MMFSNTDIISRQNLYELLGIITIHHPSDDSSTDPTLQVMTRSSTRTGLRIPQPRSLTNPSLELASAMLGLKELLRTLPG